MNKPQNNGIEANRPKEAEQHGLNLMFGYYDYELIAKVSRMEKHHKDGKVTGFNISPYSENWHD